MKKRTANKTNAIKQFYAKQLGIHEESTWWAIYSLVAAKHFEGDYPDKKAVIVKRLKALYKELNGRAVGVPRRAKRQSGKFESSAEFYKSRAWRELRYLALKNTMGCCQLCGARASDGVSLHVDHIIPRSNDRSKELDLGNLQVLCDDCNLGKNNYDSVNWRQLWRED